MKVLSLFDGISCGRVALDRADIKVSRYVAYEIDKYAKSISEKNYPDIEHMGDVTEADFTQYEGFDLLIGGSPCQGFSMAGKKLNFDDPRSRLFFEFVRALREAKPKYFFFENPRGGMRKMDFMQEFPRYTVTYCKYGERRMKPTDIWTNHPDPKFIPHCKNGDTCHEAAPRGARTGTQSLKNAREKSKIPDLLCEHIVDICEEIVE